MAQISRRDVGKSRERFFQQSELIRRRALLRSKGSRRATFSEKRIQHVGRCCHVRKSEITRGRDVFKIAQIGNQVCQFAAVLVQKTKSERTRHPEAAIIRRASAQTDDDLLRVAPDCVAQHLADAECIRAERIALVRRDAPGAGSLAHFKDGRCAFAEPDISRLDRAPERIMRSARDPFASASFPNQIGRPLASIGNRLNVDDRVGQDIAQGLCDLRGHFARFKRAFEFIGRNENSHLRNLLTQRSQRDTKVL